ncbi:HD domain-containing protein [Thalassospira lucentensis]|uniref:HD domain-containing protein n=1 Tax=Thalassospira lucentensis TaxID=168935 RepID=UPI003AA7CBE3
MANSANKMIKDPIHSFINFNGSQELLLKDILSDPFFQRLRRVKQLGFSDYVFPSATHSRFSHSLGVYNIAKRMLLAVEDENVSSDWTDKGFACLAAALLHDVGHGMFSHAFEKAIELFAERNPTDGEKLKKSANHENISTKIILDSSITKALENIGGNEFPKSVAEMIKKSDKKCIYKSIVSSQLDADRLDYAIRDPYFAGVSSGGIDLEWILKNLKVESSNGTKFLFVRSKAYVSLEQFTVTLFHLYPTIYLHKKTRSLEYMFSLLICRVFELISSNEIAHTGLTHDHPLAKFFHEPEQITNLLSLDDSLFWGALYLFKNANDPKIRNISERISERKLFPMIDVWRVADRVYSENSEICPSSASTRVERISEACKFVCKKIVNIEDVWDQDFYYDTYDRPIYQPLNEKGGHPQQINVEVGGSIMDINLISPIVASSASFNIHRIYFEKHDEKTTRLENKLYEMLKAELSKAKN